MISTVRCMACVLFIIALSLQSVTYSQILTVNSNPGATSTDQQPDVDSSDFDSTSQLLTRLINSIQSMPKERRNFAPDDIKQALKDIEDILHTLQADVEKSGSLSQIDNSQVEEGIEKVDDYTKNGKINLIRELLDSLNGIKTETTIDKPVNLVITVIDKNGKPVEGDSVCISRPEAIKASPDHPEHRTFTKLTNAKGQSSSTVNGGSANEEPVIYVLWAEHCTNKKILKGEQKTISVINVKGKNLPVDIFAPELQK